MTENQEKTSVNKPLRDEKGRLLPGNTANPNGKPAGSISLVALLKKKLKEYPEDDKKTYAEKLIDKIMDMGIEGNDKIIRSILGYIDGMPKESISASVDQIIRVRLSESEDTSEENDTGAE